MNEEVMRVLKMVEEGKISAEQAKTLIEKVNQISNKNEVTVIDHKSYEDKFLKVKVISAGGDKVNVKLPVKIIKEILKVTGKLPINTEKLEGVDINELVSSIIQCLDNEVMGEIVNVSSAGGDIVQVIIE